MGGTISPLVDDYRAVTRAALESFCASHKIEPCVSRDTRLDAVSYHFQHGHGAYTFLFDDFEQCVGRAYFTLISMEILK